MTVESSSRKATFAGGQSALTFAFRTLTSHPEYIKVLATLTATGVNTTLVYNTDYTVALLPDGTGGTVTVSPTFSTAYTMTVYRDTNDLQESDYNDFNQFPASTLEDDLDRRTLISQERSDDSNRTAKLPISYTGGTVSLPNPIDGYSLIWSGGNLVNSSLTGSTGAIGPTGPSGSTSLRVKVGSFTRDLTATSGTVTITGVGFTPKSIMLNWAVSGGLQFGSGFGDGTNQSAAYFTSAGVLDQANDRVIMFNQGAGGSQIATLSSFNSDGYVLGWTKAGSPTGSGLVQYICHG